MVQERTGWTVSLVHDLHRDPFCTIRHIYYTRATGQQVNYAMISTNDAVVVMGVTEDKKVPVVLVDRPAAGWSLELPYGGQEKGQTPEQAAHDEFNQETPWLAETLHYLGPTAPQTDRLLSLTREGDVKLAHMFLATGLTPAPQDLEPHEVVVPYLVDLDILAEVTLTGDPLPDIGLPMLDTASCLTVQRGAYLLKKL